MKPSNARDRHNGFGLIEIMVGLVIGLVAMLIIGQVTAVFEAQKRTSTGGGDAQSNGATALMALEREIRMAGYGLVAAGSQLCPMGINIYYNGNVVSDPGANPIGGGILAPVRIVDGGSGGNGPDSIIMVRSDSALGALPTSVQKQMPTPSSVVTVNNGAGLGEGDLFIVAASNGSKICTLMQMSKADPQETGNGVNLLHASGQYPYNPPNLENAFTDAPQYTINDVVINMGSFMYRRYMVQCNQLAVVDPSRVASPYTCTNSEPMVDEIVNLQARYGVAPVGSQTVDQWVEPTGEWAATAMTSAHINRIKAVRVAVVARSRQMEKTDVSCTESSATLDLWSGGPQMTLSGDQCKYRYKIFQTIVPMKNVIWGNLS